MLRRGFLLTPLAPILRGRADAHPRLFLDAQGFERLKTAITGTHAPIWARVKERADALALQQPPRYEDHLPSRENDEQLWQRPVGEALPYLSMAYRLTGESKYLQAARAWALASVGYEHWSTGSQADADLSAGHQSFGLAVTYDWLYDSLDAEARDVIRRQLIRHCNLMWLGIPRIRKPLLQNHLWVCITGLGTAALALAGEPEAGWQPLSWLELVREKYHGTEFSLGPDGASQEGVPYWSYGAEYMLKWWHLASDLLGENSTSPWWKNTAAYRLYLGLPRHSWSFNNTVVDFGDGPRADYYGADHLMHRLAQLYRDPHAQWVAEELTSAKAAHDTAGWLNLIWYDPTLSPTVPSHLPTLHHFRDLEILSARSDWSGGESLVAFKCGPPGGHAAPSKFSTDPGVGHAHPDANHFVVFGEGEWLIRDDGYARKFTLQHNTLLVDGRGQLGEGGDWLNARDWFPGPGEHPGIFHVRHSRRLDEFAGQAAPAYPESAGVRSFVRHLYFLKPDVVIVADDIVVDRERQLELCLHPEQAPERAADGSFLARGRTAVLRVEPLTPEGLEIYAREVSVSRTGAPGRGQRMPEIRLGCRRAKWRNLTALSWARAGTEPVQAVLRRKGESWTVQAGTRKIDLQWLRG